MGREAERTEVERGWAECKAARWPPLSCLLLSRRCREEEFRTRGQMHRQMEQKRAQEDGLTMGLSSPSGLQRLRLVRGRPRCARSPPCTVTLALLHSPGLHPIHVLIFSAILERRMWAGGGG